MNELNLWRWAKDNLPSDEMVYKDNFCNWISFMEKLVNMMFSQLTSNLDYNDSIAVLNNHHSIIGTHISKSVKLPVIMLRYNSCKIILRYNFYDTEVTIISYKDIDLTGFESMINSDDKSVFFHQGIPDKYIVDNTYTKNRKEFTMSIVSNYDLYTVLAVAKKSILTGIINKTLKNENRNGGNDIDIV